MANEYVVDAHALIWYVEDNPRLGANAGRIMDDPDSLLILPIIALAEACWTVERGKCRIPTVADLLADVDADPRLRVRKSISSAFYAGVRLHRPPNREVKNLQTLTLVPLDRTILDIAQTLTAIGEMHDRQIAATVLYRARLGGTVSLLTRDENITASGLVPVIW